MTTHRYSPPERKPSQWGGLSDEARAALGYVAMGPKVAIELIGADKLDVYAQGAETLRPEVLEWARTELDADRTSGGLGSWGQYQPMLGSTVPRSVDQLFQTNPNFIATLNRLYKAKQELTNSSIVTPDGENVGDTMHLLAIPWQDISDNRMNLGKWVSDLRQFRGGRRNNHIAPYLLENITKDEPMYRSTGNPSHRLTSTEYLAQKIEQDGPWGVALTQARTYMGVAHNIVAPSTTYSPDDMTNNGADHFEVAGRIVDSMGIYEWLSLSLQEAASTLIFSRGDTWMLANRIGFGKLRRVPVGSWEDSQVVSGLNWSDFNDTLAKPRLTVM